MVERLQEDLVKFLPWRGGTRHGPARNGAGRGIPRGGPKGRGPQPPEARASRSPQAPGGGGRGGGEAGEKPPNIAIFWRWYIGPEVGGRRRKPERGTRPDGPPRDRRAKTTPPHRRPTRPGPGHRQQSRGGEQGGGPTGNRRRGPGGRGQNDQDNRAEPPTNTLRAGAAPRRSVPGECPGLRSAQKKPGALTAPGWRGTM